jgi:hypothetical protein
MALSIGVARLVSQSTATKSQLKITKNEKNIG